MLRLFKWLWSGFAGFWAGFDPEGRVGLAAKFGPEADPNGED